MAERCPICFREVTVDPVELGPNLCTKRVDSQQWRRTECFNIGLSSRNEMLAAERALSERLLARVEELEAKIKADNSWGSELALREMDDG